MGPQGQKYFKARETAEAAGILFDVVPPPLETLEALRYWEAFSLLSRTRGFNEAGPQPIALTEITCYLDEEKIFDYDRRSDYIFFILTLNDRHRELIVEKAKAPARSGKGKHGRRR